mgnify:FL=1
MKRIYLHSAYERIWHWGQALAITLLLVTGMEIHFPQRFALLGFETAVSVHNVLGFLLLANAFLGLFYELSTGAIRAYIPEPRDFISLATRQLVYYTKGIFRGAPHPIAKSHDKRFNPLQQLTYLAILNVLLPGQIITGLLMWGGQRWPELVAAVGGLATLAAIHTLFAWLFAAFVLMHIYLTTTAGPRWRSGIVGMITGWEELEAPTFSDDSKNAPSAQPAPAAKAPRAEEETA